MAKSRDTIPEIPFPAKGIDTSTSYAGQPQGTSADLLNVRAYDPVTGRMRGSQRGGVSKHLADQVNGSASIQLIDHIVATELAEGQEIVETITSTQTWTCPAGVGSVQVECWAGGGGGQSGSDAGGGPSGGNGGGGGAYSIETSLAVTPGDNYTATVGAGGTGGVLVGSTPAVSGAAGGDTWFSSAGTVLAKGGGAGTGSAGTGGASASGVGDTKYSGGNGGTATGSPSGGAGGGSSAGTAANGGNGSVPTGGTAPTGGGAGGAGKSNASEGPGVAGSIPGGGGGGGLGDSNTPSGGNGAAGQIRLTYTQVATLGVRGLVGVTVAGGTIKKFNEDGLASLTNGSGALSSSRQVIFGAQLFNKYYFVDGNSTYKYLDVTTATVSTWTASAGSLPTSGANGCRQITRWRGRLVMTALDGDAHNWFMSAQGDADDWDYGASPVVATMAVAGNNSDAGKVGDIINCLIPFTDDVLIFGCDHSIWQMTGDPMAGGQIDMLTGTIGMAWGRPFAMDPYGAVWFMSSRGPIYRLTTGQAPERVSQAIDRLLEATNFNTHVVSMAWDDYCQGLHVFITPLDSAATATHWWFDARTQGWFKDRFADLDLNPKCAHVYDGDDPDDRVVLIGSWDGYIRKIDVDADDDDGTAINSYAFLGPIQMKGAEGFDVQELEGTLANDSDDVALTLYSGNTPENALESAKWSGVFAAGRSRTQRPRIFGHAHYLKISNDVLNEHFSIERIQAMTSPRGRIRRRAG